MKSYETRPDSGALMASVSKRSDKAPDYWGEVSIDIKNLQNAKVEGNVVTFKLSGWKKKSKAGSTYLSLAVDRRVPDGQAPQSKSSRQEIDDDDIPF